MYITTVRTKNVLRSYCDLLVITKQNTLDCNEICKQNNVQSSNMTSGAGGHSQPYSEIAKPANQC